MSEFLVTSLQTLLHWVFVILECLLYIPFAFIKTFTSTTIPAPPLDSRKTVVIVGANFSGLAALWKLQPHADLFRIVLIDQKEFSEYTPGLLRLFCNPKLFGTLTQRLPEDKEADSYQVLQGKVTSMLIYRKTQAIISNKTKDLHQHQHQHQHQNKNATKVITYLNQVGLTKTLPYDYLIMATGSSYQYPITASNNELFLRERQRGWDTSHYRLVNAKRILVLGGGAVGVELAAEIIDHFPSAKQVTLVQGNEGLVPLFPKKVGDYAEQWLTAKGVILHLGQRLKAWNDKSCTFLDGTVLHADLVYVCFGGRPNSEFLSNTTTSTSTNEPPLSPSKSPVGVPISLPLDGHDNILVKDTLQVQGHLNADGCIFASGDVAAPPREGENQAFQAEMQGKLAGLNVVRKELGQRLLRYPQDITGGIEQMPLVFVLSLGRFDGVLGFNWLLIPGPIAPVFKWTLEYTKVLHMKGRPLGKLIWKIGDAACLFLSRTVIKPSSSSSSAVAIASSNDAEDEEQVFLRTPLLRKRHE